MKGTVRNIPFFLYLLFAGALIYRMSLFLLRYEHVGQTPVWIVLGLATGGVFTMALYSITLYLFRPAERELVFFAFFCLAVCLRFLFVDGSIGMMLFPQAEAVKTELFAVGSTIMVVCHFNFICELFAGGGYCRSRWCISVLIPLYAMTVILLGVIDTPPEVAVKVFISLAETILSMVVIIRSGQLRNCPANFLYFITNLWYCISFFLVSTRMPFLIVPTNCVFMIAHMIVLADRYARAIRGQEEINSRLELAVTERTAELQEAYVQVADSERHLKELVGNISHDLKTPLAVAGVNLEQLIDPERPKSPEESRRLATVAYHKNLDLQRMTRNLFDVVRMEGGGLSYTLTWTGLDNLMAEAYRRYVDDIESRVVLPVILYHGRCQVHIDQEKIWNVFDNLINNALRYTPEGGSITLEAAWDGAEVVDLAFRDTGCGIGEEHLSHIFDRYYKVDQSRGGRRGKWPGTVYSQIPGGGDGRQREGGIRSWRRDGGNGAAEGSSVFRWYRNRGLSLAGLRIRLTEFLFS